jgi:hypothetical protein
VPLLVSYRFLRNIARFLPGLILLVAFAFLLIPDSGCGKGIFPEVTPTTTATTVPTSTIIGSSSPTATATAGAIGQPFSMTGTGTELNAAFGTCSGMGCASSHGSCTCLTFSGTLDGTLIGKSNWDAGITVNLDDCENTGTPSGFCCVGDGKLTITSSASGPANTIGMSITGAICENPEASEDLSLGGNFKILPSLSGGKFANSNGTGRINAFAASSNGTTYLDGSGAIQSSSPL